MTTPPTNPKPMREYWCVLYRPCKAVGWVIEGRPYSTLKRAKTEAKLIREAIKETRIVRIELPE